MIRCIVADPPWTPCDKLPGPSRGAARQYPVMTTPEICALADVNICGELRIYGEAIADDAVLFLWRLGSMQRDALEVAEAWGFRDIGEVVWNKETKLGKRWFGMGRLTRGAHETALVCVRGKYSRLRKSKAIRSSFDAPVPVDARGRYIHSAKPERFFTDIVEPLVEGPYLEIFARRRRPGWAAIGNQLPQEINGGSPHPEAGCST